MNDPNIHPSGFAGIGILGVLIALAIILFLYFGPTGSGGTSTVERAMETKKMGEQLSLSMQARGLADAIGAHILGGDGSDPTSFEDLGVSASQYIDPWRNQMIFRIEQSPRQVVLISAGPDGQMDTEDDVKGVAPLSL